MCIYRGDNKVAPMPNHHPVKGYRTSGHKALPILDPGTKWIMNATLASDIFRTQWMHRKCIWTWQKLKCRYQTSHFTDGDICLLVQLMFSVKLNLFTFLQEWCSLGYNSMYFSGRLSMFQSNMLHLSYLCAVTTQKTTI